MTYYEYTLENQLDFTHPFMTINQMKKMLISNFNDRRDYYIYGDSSEELIVDFENQIKKFFPYDPDLIDLRMPILVFPIPTGEMWEPVKYGFIKKLEANGETIVYSPIPIPSLEKKHSSLSEEEIKMKLDPFNILDRIEENE